MYRLFTDVALEAYASVAWRGDDAAARAFPQIQSVPFSAVPCESLGDGSRVAGSGFTDATGWLRLHVDAFLSSPGLYCVELIVAGSGVAAPDTLRGLEVPMTRGTPTDTIRVIRRVDA
jgi:hypothetical protein